MQKEYITHYKIFMMNNKSYVIDGENYEKLKKNAPTGNMIGLEQVNMRAGRHVDINPNSIVAIEQVQALNQPIGHREGDTFVIEGYQEEGRISLETTKPFSLETLLETSPAKHGKDRLGY